MSADREGGAPDSGPNAKIERLKEDVARLEADGGESEEERLRRALLFMLEDVETSRRRIEQAHREWIAAIDGVRDPIFFHDNEFRIVRANRAYAERAGLPIKEVIGKRYFEVFPKRDGPLAACLRALPKTEEEEEEVRVETGEILLSRSFTVRAEDGAYLFSTHILTDITERKKAERELRETRDFLKNLFDHANAPIIVWDPSFRITMFNNAFERLTGRGAGEVIGKEIDILFPPGRRDEALAHIHRTAGGDRWETVEIPIQHLSGEVRTALWNSATLYSADGKSVLATIAQGQDITERKRAEDTIRRVNRALYTLSAGNGALVRVTDEATLLQEFCRVAVEVGGYRLAFIGFAEDDAEKTVSIVAQRGAETGYLESLGLTWADTDKGQSTVGRAIRGGAPQVAQDVATDPKLAVWRAAAARLGVRASASLPLKGENGKTFGALTIGAAETDAFDGDEVNLLTELANDLAFGIATLRTRIERDRIAQAHQHHEKILRKGLEDSIRAIAATVEARDPYTAGHQRRVAELATAIARDLGLPEDRIHGLYLAAVVHDLGKIHVPAEILSKPGKLSDIEFALIKTHCQTGHDILKDIEFPWPIARMVIEHHERLDGSGYPHGRKGDELLPESKIMTVADVVEAIMSHRPYRPALGLDAALAEVTKGRGTFYDPAVVDACVRLFREKGFAFN